MIDTDPQPIKFESAPKLPMATFHEGKFFIDGRRCFELPPGSHRPEQMLLSNLLESVFPVGKICVATVEDSGGLPRYFSMYEDVTDPNMPTRPMALVQAEYVALREIFLCKDRTFNSKPGYSYPDRLPGVMGHNMDWIQPDINKDDIRAVHYDFELFYKFLNGMTGVWIQPDEGRMDKMKKEIAPRFDSYEALFGNRDFLPPLIELLNDMQKKFTLEYVTQCNSRAAVVRSQEKSDDNEIHKALQIKLAFYIDLLKSWDEERGKGS